MLHMFRGGWMMGHWGWPMLLLPALFWLLMIGIIIWIAVLASNRSKLSAPADSALEILKRRYDVKPPIPESMIDLPWGQPR